jgi:hypothetical protein
MLEQLLLLRTGKYWCEKPADAERKELSAFSCSFSEPYVKRRPDWNALNVEWLDSTR